MEHLAEDFFNTNSNVVEQENKLKHIFSIKKQHEEYQYLNLIQNIIENGFIIKSKNFTNII